jgi:elongation factor Ts
MTVAISAQMVKELREQTGAGMMDCKGALAETGGDMEAAVDWLRKKGLSKAAKKAGRVAAEGLIGVMLSGTKGVAVEVNSETDFVARNDLFQGLVKMIAQVALGVGTDVATIKAAKVGSITIDEAIAESVAKIGENMTLRRADSLSVGQGVIASYVHNSVGDGLGKIGVIVGLESSGKADELAAFGRQEAMHVASGNPQALDAKGLDPAVVAREDVRLPRPPPAADRPDTARNHGAQFRHRAVRARRPGRAASRRADRPGGRRHRPNRRRRGRGRRGQRCAVAGRGG